MRHETTITSMLVSAVLLIGLASHCPAIENTTAPEAGEAKPAADSPNSFVQVEGTRFTLEGKPYQYVGANVWYAAYLGSENSDFGNRDRLIKELDSLHKNGIDNLRIMGATEKSTLRDSMRPAISFEGKVINEDVLVGLDFTLAEMAKREMKAVIVLNNFWEWSGGMATYVSWVKDGEIVDMADPTKPWPAYALYAAQFYGNEDAKALANMYLRTLITRRNSVTGQLYSEDPTIMSWQLANEPRPGAGDISKKNLDAFYQWITETSSLIKSLAPNQLVSLGSEGMMGCLGMKECVIDAHTNTGVDYMTFHMWPKNWSWFDAMSPETTYDSAEEEAGKYIDLHIKLAKEVGMPLVLEEFGLERDKGEFAPTSSVEYRNRFYRFVFKRVEQSIDADGVLVGTNFWSWGGYGSASHPDYAWRTGDKSFLGDPPQEPQGLNTVFASDAQTIQIIRQHGRTIRQR